MRQPTNTQKARKERIKQLKRELAAVRARNSELRSDYYDLSWAYDQRINSLWSTISTAISPRFWERYSEMLKEAMRLEEKLMALDPKLRTEMENMQFFQ